MNRFDEGIGPSFEQQTNTVLPTKLCCTDQRSVRSIGPALTTNIKKEMKKGTEEPEASRSLQKGFEC
jgi:hypothetical protein